MLNRKCTLLAAVMLWSLSGCSSANNSSAISVLETVDSPVSQPQIGYYDDMFIGFDINPSLSPYTSYDDSINLMSQDEKLDSLYLVETVKLLTLSECAELKGFKEWFKKETAIDYDELLAKTLSTDISRTDGNLDYFSDFTIYEVNLLEDLISGEKLNDTIYISTIEHNPQTQFGGDPPRAPGEMFTIALDVAPVDSDITDAAGSYMLQYDVIKQNDTIFAYSRNNYEIDELNLTSSENITQSIITSTTQNPACYTQKLELSELTEFLRIDWKQRKISKHFAENN